MTKNFAPGDQKFYKKKVLPEDIANFNGQVVHEVYATFALARDMEWSSRLFILEMIKEDEEGIGTELSIKHINPAFVGEELTFEAIVTSISGNSLICGITVKSGEKIVATGSTGQRILKKERLKKLFLGLK